MLLQSQPSHRVTVGLALLIGITYAHLEELLLFAGKLIDMSEGPASDSSAYSRWKVVDSA
jgi:hypothetical protein